jgi:hypothetical protein
MTRGTTWRGRRTRALTVLLWLGACGPSATINRSATVSEIGDASDGGGTGGTSEAGGSGGSSTGGSAGNGSGGTGSGGTGYGGTGTGGAGGGTGYGGSGGTLATGGAGGASGAGGAVTDTAGPAPDAALDTIANQAPVLMVSSTLAGATANLTTVGKLDWTHWGYVSTGTVTRKKVSPGLITMKKVGAGSFGHYDSRPATLSWTDGSPTLKATDISDGIVAGDVTGAGFEIQVKGTSSRPRTLTIYLGGWQAAAKFTAQLGSSPATSYSNEMFRATDPGADRVYTIVFQPSTDTDVLVVRWTATEILQTYGNVTLQAAALSE